MILSWFSRTRAPLLLAAALLMIFLAAGCSGLTPTAQQPLPTVVLGPNSGSAAATNVAPTPETGAASAPEQSPAAGEVAASGVVIPAQAASLAVPLSGSVDEVLVSVGDTVSEGDLLVRFAGAEKLTAAVESANFELLAAQQALTTLKEDADLARANAAVRLAEARDTLDIAEKRRGWKEYRVGNDIQIDVARADLIVAEDTLKHTEDGYGGYANDPADNLNKAAALSALSAARMARDKALANLNYLLSLPDEIEVGKADAQLEMAQADEAAARRAYERLKNGPDPDSLALSEARVTNAQAQLAAARAALVELEIKAPFAGTVTVINVHRGEWAGPGQAALSIADLDPLEVETTDLSERDVPLVQTGQQVNVLIKALNKTVAGQVREIAPLADTIGGDVVYRAVITLAEYPADLRAGMSVEVSW